jgi:hypothetical protein
MGKNYWTYERRDGFKKGKNKEKNMRALWILVGFVLHEVIQVLVHNALQP